MLTSPKVIGLRKDLLLSIGDLTTGKMEDREWCFYSLQGRNVITVLPSPYFCDYPNTATSTTVFLTRSKEDNFARSWALSIATSESEKKKKRYREKFSALWVFSKT